MFIRMILIIFDMLVSFFLPTIIDSFDTSKHLQNINRNLTFTKQFINIKKTASFCNVTSIVFFTHQNHVVFCPQRFLTALQAELAALRRLEQETGERAALQIAQKTGRYRWKKSVSAVGWRYRFCYTKIGKQPLDKIEDHQSFIEDIDFVPIWCLTIDIFYKSMVFVQTICGP